MRFLSLFFVAGLAVACSSKPPSPTTSQASSSSAPSSPAATEIPRAEFAAKLAKSFCAATAPCCTGGVVYDEAVCTKQVLGQVGVEEAVAKAKNYNGKTAAKCLDEVKPLGASCESGRDPILNLPSCAATISGPGKTGSPCEEKGDCAKPEKGDAFCWTGGMADAPGRCAVSLPPALGAPCFTPLGTEDKKQLTFSECNNDKTMVCDKATNKCAPRQKAGGACEQAYECDDNSVCSGAGTCKSMLGAPCKETRSCAIKQSCSKGKCVAGKKLGESCDDFAECAEGMCTGMKTCGTWAAAFLCKVSH